MHEAEAGGPQPPVSLPLALLRETQGDSETQLRVPSVSVAWPAAFPQVGALPALSSANRRRQPVPMPATRPSVPGRARPRPLRTATPPARPHRVRPDAHDEGPEAGAARLPSGRSPPAATPPPRSAFAAKQRGKGVSPGTWAPRHRGCGSHRAGRVRAGITSVHPTASPQVRDSARGEQAPALPDGVSPVCGDGKEPPGTSPPWKAAGPTGTGPPWA